MPEVSGPQIERYFQAAMHLGQVLGRLESALVRLGNGDRLTESTLREVAGWPTEDTLRVCVGALEAFGILTREGAIHRVNRSQLDATAGYRKGVHDALRLKTSHESQEQQLLATVPHNFPSELIALFHLEAMDLRTAILDLIAGANTELMLASPFWDSETLEELTKLLDRRVAAGVKIRILGRGQADRTWLTTLREQVPSLQCFSWYAPTATGINTFHFKAAIADRTTGYLGSANFTQSGLWSCLELGYRLYGRSASQLGKVLDGVFRCAERLP